MHTQYLTAETETTFQLPDSLAFTPFLHGLAQAAAMAALKQSVSVLPLPLSLEIMDFSLDFSTPHTDTLHMRTSLKAICNQPLMPLVNIAAAAAASVVCSSLPSASWVSTQAASGKKHMKPPRYAAKTAVVVCSDSVSAGHKEDIAGKTAISMLEQWGIETSLYAIIPDDAPAITNALQQAVTSDIELLLYVGGTGLSPRDITPEIITPLLDRTIPGVMEAARQFGQKRTPYAMLSRGVAGFKGKTLVITLPGSTKGATETLEALFPWLLHIFDVAKSMRHD